MALTTTIKWREYPAEKPTKQGDHLCLFAECFVHPITFYEGRFLNQNVTHFALAEDITTQESEEADKGRES